MSHYEKNMWNLYIENKLDRKQQEELEHHLYSCPQCVDDYMDMLEHVTLPTIEAPEQWTDEVMAQLPPKQQIKQSTKKNQLLLHYTIAAAATIVLMVSGIFQGVVDTEIQGPNDMLAKQEQPISEKLLEKISIVSLKEGKE
ncbi:zf-HC2 domain-containing protein [Alkalihalobacillus sp. LMS39]|uniref:anti-sigma factor family protein n=1 Tax=Alkalihalobacillus sp. LMS39 TaxID=2924032 RepID=UPI001FB412DE|nr:zf-HC2 domain-containing protein [Alkalihalobacillus sp. LMS39]UOE94502.1 zf-HC2 domain-containing protein [Alkalihalobacillus sp. LMS39]